MPQFVIERDIPGAGNLSDAELQAVARKSLGRTGRNETGNQVAPLLRDRRQNLFVYLAPDEESVREHPRRGALPANRVSAVRHLIAPNCKMTR